MQKGLKMVGKKLLAVLSAISIMGTGIICNKTPVYAEGYTVEDGAVTYTVFSEYAVLDYVNPLTAAIFQNSIKSYVDGVPVVGIDGDAFYLNAGISTVTIPETVRYIFGDMLFGAFGGSTLTSIDIPENVTLIGQNAFAVCSELQSITIRNPECEIYDDARTIFTGVENSVPYFSGTIYGYTDSTAEEYAEKYGYNFVALDSQPATEPPSEEVTEAVTETVTETPSEEPVPETPVEQAAEVSNADYAESSDTAAVYSEEKASPKTGGKTVTGAVAVSLVAAIAAVISGKKRRK
jgi:hypothetical protein